MKPGLDLLAMAHPLFPFERMIKEVSRDTPLGFFWSHFGSIKARFQIAINEGFTIFRPQMYWNDAHIIVPMNVLQSELVELKGFLAKNSSRDLNVYVSPSCEHAERNVTEVKKRLDLTAQLLPDVKVVNNPWKGQGAVVPGYLTEFHGSRPGKCDLTSWDGENIYDGDAISWLKTFGNSQHPSFRWGYRFNLREIGDPGQKPPPVKDRKAAPSPQYWRSILAMDAVPEPAPTFKAGKTQPFVAPNIYKTHAEDDQEINENEPDELRENRPVLIIKSNANLVDILTHDGKNIGKLPRYGSVGSFPGGLTRYYSGVGGGVGLYGYEIANKAKRASGSPWVWFRHGARVIGPVHPTFRAGVFR